MIFAEKYLEETKKITELLEPELIENMADELEKMQRALNQSYADRDRIGSDLDKIRDDLERSQVNILLQI